MENNEIPQKPLTALEWCRIHHPDRIYEWNLKKMTAYAQYCIECERALQKPVGWTDRDMKLWSVWLLTNCDMTGGKPDTNRYTQNGDTVDVQDLLQQYKQSHQPVQDSRIEQLREWLKCAPKEALPYTRMLEQFDKLFPKTN